MLSCKVVYNYKLLQNILVLLIILNAFKMLPEAFIVTYATDPEGCAILSLKLAALGSYAEKI